MASSTGDGDTSQGNDSHYYFNPHIDPGSARKRRSRAQAERRRRRRVLEGGDDLEAGEEEEDDDEDDFGSTVDEGDIAEEDESVLDTPDQEYREEQTFERGRREGKQPRDGLGKQKSRFRPHLLDRDSNDHDIFAADHSPSPSRPTSPNRVSALEAGQGYGTIDTSAAKGKAAGKNSMRRWDSQRTVTSGNAFDQSTRDYRGWADHNPDESDESKQGDVSLNEESETEDHPPAANVQPLRKASAISLRLPTEFSRGIPGGGMTPFSPGAHPHDQPSSSTPLTKPRRASNMSALSTPVRRDARQGSFASYNRGVRRGSMTLALSPGAQEQAVLQARKMSVGVKDIKGRQVEVGRSTSGQTVSQRILS